MAENNDLPVGEPDAPEAGITRRPRLVSPAKPRRFGRRAARTTTDVATVAPVRPVRARRHHPVRSLITIAAVTGLVATVAIPAYAVLQPEEQTATVQQLAEKGAQTLVVASDVETSTMARDSYSATTPDEIAKKQAAEAAEARAKAVASSASWAVPAGVPLVAPGSGIVRRPLPYFNNFGAPYAGHRGTDYMVERGTPIYSIADGVVTQSVDSGGGLGVTITIQHNINGHAVESVYGHMLQGSRTVGVGATVSAGQMIGQVSDTGMAFGTHLHLMIHVDGTRVDAEGWLVANAG